MTSTRMTWDEIKKAYPDTWVGMVNVQYVDDDGVNIASAEVKYTDKTKAELTRRMLDGEIVSRYTTPDSKFQLGMAGAMG